MTLGLPHQGSQAPPSSILAILAGPGGAQEPDLESLFLSLSIPSSLGLEAANL